MSLYRKRPVVIEARQLTDESSTDVYLWAESVGTGSFEFLHGKRRENAVSIDPSTGAMVIYTLEGLMTVGFGDWVIRGVKGEMYPCKDDVFRLTYEEVVEAEPVRADA